MRPLTAQQLMAAWEAGRDASPGQRAALILAWSNPNAPREELAGLPLGAVNLRLLQLREWAFGAALKSVTDCPNCRERLELSFDVADLRIGPEPTPEPLSLTADGYELSFHLPRGADLEDLDQVADPRRGLLCRCVERASQGGAERDVASLPAKVMDALERSIIEADPQADVQARLACSDCGHEWLARFDVLSFFWEEIESWAQCTLHEIHHLASAYGWSEACILALSPRRRQAYLEWVAR